MASTFAVTVTSTVRSALNGAGVEGWVSWANALSANAAARTAPGNKDELILVFMICVVAFVIVVVFIVMSVP
jgi:t-SNARE complex subunit (syntaxin)